MLFVLLKGDMAKWSRCCKGLPFFHAFKGCDSISAIRGRGKSTCWEAWRAYKDVSDAFSAVNDPPFRKLNIISTVFAQVVRYVVIMYHRASTLDRVNEARLELFTKHGRSIEKIPPTQDALYQQVLTASYQS